MYPKILEISHKTGVPVANILDALSILSGGKAIDNTDLIHQTGLSHNSLNQIKQELKNYLEPSSQNTKILPRYQKDILELTKNHKKQDNLYEFFKNKDYQKALTILNKYKKFAIKPNRKFDQFIAGHDTVARRTSALNYFGDLKNKKILFLGDDDFTSIAASSLQLADQITVLDIDRKVLSRISQIAKAEKYDIETDIYDARNLLPKKYINLFDIVLTDPPYTPEGIELFLSRSIKALNNRNKAARIYFFYGESDKSKERTVPIFDTISQLGLIIRWTFDKFSHYHGAESIGSSSNLYICEVTPRTQNTIQGKYEQKIYTYN